jgi:hypothetical protein
MKIYPKDDKRRLYWLIELYVAGEIDENTFCDEIYYSYDLEIDKKTLDVVEKLAFEELVAITDRFSPFESDIKMAPKAFADKEELKSAVIKAKKALDGHMKE